MHYNHWACLHFSFKYQDKRRDNEKNHILLYEIRPSARMNEIDVITMELI